MRRVERRNLPKMTDIKSGNEESDIHTIQAECSNMISLLKILEKEEHDIQCQLEIFSREALLCGFQNDVVEPPIPKKRTKKLKEKEQ